MLRVAAAIGLCCLAGGSALVGCSSSGGVAGSGGTGAVSADSGGEGGALMGAVSCLDDPRVDTYRASLERLGNEGLLTFVLRSSEPAPPAKGENTFEVSVSDAAGTPSEGTLTVDLFMPDHGHGTSVTPVVSFDPSSAAYTIDPVYLFMPGVWRVTLGYYAGATDPELLDQAVLYFCVEG